jgi:hypothetical protein
MKKVNDEKDVKILVQVEKKCKLMNFTERNGTVLYGYGLGTVRFGTGTE